MIRALLAALRVSPVTREYEKLEAVIKHHAQLSGDEEFHTRMSTFYTGQALSIDPWEDHWAFATARHKQLEHQDQVQRYMDRANEAYARVEAQRARLDKVRGHAGTATQAN